MAQNLSQKRQRWAGEMMAAATNLVDAMQAMELLIREYNKTGIALQPAKLEPPPMGGDPVLTDQISPGIEAYPHLTDTILLDIISGATTLATYMNQNSRIDPWLKVRP